MSSAVSARTAAAVVKRYTTTRDSIRDVADRYGLTFQVCRTVLLKNNVLCKQRGGKGDPQVRDRRPVSTLDLAARDNSIRHVLIALRDNGPMYLAQLTTLPGCSGAHYQIKRLKLEGYLSQTEVREGTSRYCYMALTPKGEALVHQAEQLYRARLPSALAAKQATGQSLDDIAVEVGLSRTEVYTRIRVHKIE